MDGRLSKKDFGNLVKKLGMPSLTDKNGSNLSTSTFALATPCTKSPFDCS